MGVDWVLGAGAEALLKDLKKDKVDKSMKIVLKYLIAQFKDWLISNIRGVSHLKCAGRRYFAPS